MGWKIMIAVLVLSTNAIAQDVESGERQGLLEVSGSIYPTFSYNNQSLLNVVGGHLAYQLDDHNSFRGDAYASTSTQYGGELYNDLVLIEGSFIRNFTWNRFDVFTGLGMGIAGVQVNRNPGGYPYTYPSRRYYQPNLDLTIGFKFHASNYFYFYAETHNWVMHHPEANSLLGNFSVTGGLGLQLPCKKLRDTND